MKSFIIKFLVCFFMSISMTYAQEKRESDNSINRLSSEIYQYSQDVTNFLQISQIESFGRQGNALNPQDGRNVVLIQQIGVGNTLSTRTNSQTSNMEYLQIGLRNTIESVNTINNASERIIQLGVDNEFLHDSFGNINSSGLNIIQTGNNLNFQKIGSNAQTMDMTVRMFGQDRTVIVRSN